MQHHSGRDLITLTYWIQSSTLDSELNTACRSITGYLKPTNVEELYLLAGIAPPDIRRDVCARVEKKKQESNIAHSLYGQNPTESRLKSRSCFFSRGVDLAEDLVVDGET